MNIKDVNKTNKVDYINAYIYTQRHTQKKKIKISYKNQNIPNFTQNQRHAN